MPVLRCVVLVLLLVLGDCVRRGYYPHSGLVAVERFELLPVVLPPSGMESDDGRID